MAAMRIPRPVSHEGFLPELPDPCSICVYLISIRCCGIRKHCAKSSLVGCCVEVIPLAVDLMPAGVSVPDGSPDTSANDTPGTDPTTIQAVMSAARTRFFIPRFFISLFLLFFESWVVTVSLSNSYCESIFQLLHTGFFCLCMLTKPLLSPLFLKIYKNHSLNCILCSRAARYSCGWKCFYPYCDSPASSGIFFAVFR